VHERLWIWSQTATPTERAFAAVPSQASFASHPLSIDRLGDVTENEYITFRYESRTYTRLSLLHELISRWRTSRMVAGRLVGAQVRRKEDPRLITGTSTYVDDVQLPNILHAAFVRSQYQPAPRWAWLR
jgi:hypothetical protein